MKKARDGLSNRLDEAKERVSELDDLLVGTSKTEMQLEMFQRWNRISQDCETITEDVTYT